MTFHSFHPTHPEDRRFGDLWGCQVPEGHFENVAARCDGCYLALLMLLRVDPEAIGWDHLDLVNPLRYGECGIPVTTVAAVERVNQIRTTLGLWVQ